MGEKVLKVTLLKHTPEPENLVAAAARLCYSADDIDTIVDKMQSNETENFVEKLLNMGHMSPIEHICFTFGIEGVSRSLLAQLTRHRIASFSVKSQRYVSEMYDDTTFSYIIPPKIKELGDEQVRVFKEQMVQMQKWYNYWVEVLGTKKNKKALEDARFVLPNAAETKIILTMNARELYHFFNLRCCNRAQWEIRDLAWEMLKIAKKISPTIFKEAGPQCIKGSCSEGKMSCGKQKEVRERYEKL
jgi:thymidylate synthase (FAD)